ncbi:hypothetical protein GYMLUDRAFT_43389 [Collybiopsis luxurians FD-317 M1]|uniref:Uncharacterized protein n=1 Tax=Collybiopsis luxurians FD-317 M1 TaxID=944289 RepID=A0A0D0CPI7_9AGAR|nr:hypothetical protein GYMLUDRAFT_43389 [Collybiopsis luxurians FD-317 M1]
MPQSEIDAVESVRTASLIHCCEHREEDPPDVVPLPVPRNLDDGDHHKYFMLVGRMAMFERGARVHLKQTDLPLDEQTKAYLDFWVGDCFKEELRYHVQYWPRNLEPMPFLLWKMDADWDDRVEKQYESLSMARSGSNSSADSALEERDELPFKYNPQIWMPVSWHIRGGVVIPPRK